MSLIACGLLVVFAGCGEGILGTSDHRTAGTALEHKRSLADELLPRLTDIGERLAGIDHRLLNVGRVAGESAPAKVAAQAVASDAWLWLPSEPLEGRIVTEEKDCLKCHSISGAGGSIGPDLAKTYFQGSFLDLGSMLWNHIPDMVVEYKALNLPQPRFSDGEITSLISYLYYLRYLGNPGNVANGEQLLKTKGCLNCHVAGQEKGGDVGPGLDRITKYASPIYMAQAIWNHQPQMQKMMDKMGVQRPTFDGQEISDLSAYLRAVSRWTDQERVYLSPGNPKQGKKVFEDKGCISCHSGPRNDGRMGPNLTALPLHKSAADIAGMMWNHGDVMLRTMEAGKIPWPTFEGKEMADLIAYLYFVKFVDPPGDVASGKTLFQEKQCASCHSIKGVGGTLGPNLARSPSISSDVATLRAMLNHAEEMSEAVLGRGEIWPLLDGQETRDIFAYLRAVGGKSHGVAARSPRPRVGGKVAIDGQKLAEWAQANEESAPPAAIPEKSAAEKSVPAESIPEEPIPVADSTKGRSPQGVPDAYEIVDALILMTPGNNLGEKLRNALGEEQTKRVIVAFYLKPECISKGNFTWSPRKLEGCKKVRVFIPTQIQAQIIVTLDGNTVWKSENLDGENVLSPEIKLDSGELKLSIEVQDRGVDDVYGGVDDVFVVRPKPTDH